MPIVTLLVSILIVCIVIWVTRQLTAAFGVPDPIATVILVVVVLICLLWFLNSTGIFRMRLT